MLIEVQLDNHTKHLPASCDKLSSFYLCSLKYSLIADAKRVKSAKGIAAGFSKAIKQGCQIVIIDFDKHFHNKPIYYPEVSRRISWRKEDFENGVIKECYIIHNGQAIKITKENYSDRKWIEDALKKSGM